MVRPCPGPHVLLSRFGLEQVPAFGSCNRSQACRRANGHRCPDPVQKRSIVGKVPVLERQGGANDIVHTQMARNRNRNRNEIRRTGQEPNAVSRGLVLAQPLDAGPVTSGVELLPRPVSSQPAVER